MKKSKVLFSRPLLPDFKEYMVMALNSFKNNDISVPSHLHKELERKLAMRFETPIALYSNGTQALTAALMSFSLKGEVITTPFSSVATAQAIKRAGLTPIFADIDADTLCLSPESVFKKISPRTSAIVPVHIFGINCDVTGFEKISNTANTKIIYDAAHAFDLAIDDLPISKFGDASAYSFNANRLFQTIEGGGAVFPRSKMTLNTARLWGNFGLNDDQAIMEGTNSKLGELNCAMGLSVFPLIEKERQKRYKIAVAYHDILGNIDGIRVHTSANAEHFVIQVAQEFIDREKIINALNNNGIQSRCYFPSLISDMPLFKRKFEDKFPNALKASKECIGLPFYSALGTDNAQTIAKIILSLKR